MNEFKRSPSKVWWGSDWREVSGSPGSQDSGFSDTDTPPLQNIQKISKDIGNKPENLAVNFQEKRTPDKIRLGRDSPRKSLFSKNSPKVSRNLFSSAVQRDKRCVKDVVSHQYAKDVEETGGEITSDCCVEGLKRSRSLPLKEKFRLEVLNKSAPAVLEDLREEESFGENLSLESDCESELECLFNGDLESPKHTSTPKNTSRMRQLKNKVPLDLYWQQQQQQARQIHGSPQTLNEPVQRWMAEVRNHYEQECMTAFQAKSIAAELHQKVAAMATYTTTNIKGVLSRSECIEQEYKNLNNDRKHTGALAQSLAGNIIDFVKTFAELTPKLARLYDSIRKSSADSLLDQLSSLFTQWEAIFRTVLEKEVRKLIDKLENPCSELDLRATTTAVTSLCLHNESLVEIFTKNEAIPVLLILCEKCQGSSMKSLLLRALSTLCSTNYAVRHFEKYSGMQIISDILDEKSTRPEPERSEAVALLAQVTAPWIEDNHSIKGLQDHSRKLVKSLTKFLSTTRCCQNLLLCTAALGNLSSMDPQCIKYMLHLQTADVLLESVNRRGPCASIYLLEQVATLIANMTSLEVARSQLIRLKTIPALLCFLKTGSMAEDVDKRLQQKAIIALSRLCSVKEAAVQVVELGGVEKLVKMCRHKEERFCSDAVLVATLATLRKITDACGRDIISVEDVQELVEPKLLDSFLAYSAQNESYV